MQTMRAAILESAPGGVHIEEIPMPEPGAGEILVKVSACGVCHTDLHVMKAEVAFPTPAVMGHEFGDGCRARTWREGSRRWDQGRVRVHHAVRILHAVRRRTRRPLRQLLRDESAEGHVV